MRTTTPLTITSRIAEALGLPDSHMADAIQMTRYKAVAEIISSFLNYSEKNDPGHRGFFASMIIRILLPEEKCVSMANMQKVVGIIKDADKAILTEIEQEKEDWRAARKADKELATA